MDYVASKEEFMEIAEAVKGQLGEGFYIMEDKHRPLELTIGRNGDSGLFGSQVYASVDEYNGVQYTAVGFRGKSDRGNGYSPAYASIIPHDGLELRQMLRFALACAFNKEIDI